MNIKKNIVPIIESSIVITGINFLIIYSFFFIINPTPLDFKKRVLFLLLHPFFIIIAYTIGLFYCKKYFFHDIKIDSGKIFYWFFIVLPTIILSFIFILIVDYMMMHIFDWKINAYTKSLEEYLISINDKTQEVKNMPIVLQNIHYVSKIIPILLIESYLFTPKMKK